VIERLLIVIYLFVHQNFPGQYRHIVEYLVRNPENKIFFISQPNQNFIPGVTKLVYKQDVPVRGACHPNAMEFDAAVRNGMAVMEICRDLKGQGIKPDFIAGHSAWGETLFLKDVFPETPILTYFEFYYHYSGVDLDFDPEFPGKPDDAFRLRTRNAVNLLSFDAADWGNSPTEWQRSLFPPELRQRISCLHEGVNTNIVKPEPDAWLSLERAGLRLTREDEVITYSARNLEPYRGFHSFMRAVPEIMRRRPNAHIIVIGGDEVSYGAWPPGDQCYREILLDEVGPAIDFDRLHFLGPVDYDIYLNVLQISSAHIYLTYPFVLSWSFIEALATGCAIIGSATPPVQEVIEDGVNGLLVDFFAPSAIADRVDQIFEHPDRMQAMRNAARATAIRDFDIETKLLPGWMGLIDDLVNKRRPRL
jgi:glycosyltransferase involved in cell wall biosynthesis